MDFNSEIEEARKTAVRRMKREQRLERREYEQELRDEGVPAQRRKELLADLEAEHRRQIKVYERRFEVAMQRVSRGP